MNLETLEKANALKNRIGHLRAIASCFYYPIYDKQGNETGELDFNHSRKPKIIIEYDDLEGDRDRYHLPVVPSEKFIKTIFEESEIELQKCIKEFEAL